MHLLSKNRVEQLRTSATLPDIHQALADAVQLELATIPVYLTGLFSIVPGFNAEAGKLLQSIVVEEMLHMTLAANMLIAIGGAPDVLALGNALRFPGQLPLSVDDGLVATLRPLTPAQVHDVMMAIEQPDTTAILPGETAPLSPPANPDDYASIGDFYAAIIERLQALTDAGADPFADPRPGSQVDVVHWFGPFRGLPPEGKVRNLDDARAAAGVIVRQGEGIDVKEGYSPDDGTRPGELAHYFLLGEIFNNALLVPDAGAPSGWSYTGAPVPLDPAGVRNLLPDATLGDYPANSGAAVAGAQFFSTYQALLRSLTLAFGGDPASLSRAMGLMYQLKLFAEQVVQQPCLDADGKPRTDAAGNPYVAAPPFMATH